MRLVLFFVLTLASSARAEPFKPPTDSLLLNIPDRPWAPGAPKEGWCAESSIQMVALHYGAWVPQQQINSLGKSTHVDLWEEDIPTALDKLGLTFERAHAKTRDEFFRWIVAQLREGNPVIVGAKLFPTDEPTWDVDHLMPVVGYSPKGLTFNTNMEWGQREISWAALGGRQGISFISPTGKFYGFAVKGFRLRGGRVTLRVTSESTDSIQLAVEAPRDAGPLLLRRDDLDGGASTVPLVEVLRLEPRESGRFSVMPAR